MIHFFTGRAGSGKSTAVIEAIRSALAIPERELVLLVPEQQTVAWESRLAAALPASANLRLEITNFTRLANTVFRTYGGLSEPVIDEGSRSLLIWRAMLGTWDSLQVYTGGAPKPDAKSDAGHEERNIPRLMAAVDELKTAGVTPAEAEKALRSLEENGEGGSDLAKRLSDAVLVYAAYNELLHEDAVDRGDLYDTLIGTLAAHPYFAGKSVFVDSFFSLTAPQERILAEIFAEAADVTVTFSCPKPQKNEPFEIQFGETRDFLKRAAVLAARAGKEPVITEFGENLRHRENEELRALERSLFCYQTPLTEKTPDEIEKMPLSESVRMIRCADKTDEAEAAAALIDRLLHEGYRCRDIVVLARNMKAREAILGPILRRHDIPCFLSETALVSTSPAVRLVLAALTVGAGGWQRADVLRLVKTGLTPLGLPENPAFLAEAFETYTATWNIRGRRLYTGGDWTMNPAGYRAEFDDAGRRMLGMANEARRLVIPALDEFLTIFDGGAACVPVIAAGLVALAEAYRLDEGLEVTAAAYEARGLGADAERIRGSWDAVCGILDRMVSSLGDTALDAGRFAGLFARVAQCMDVGAIPTAIDEVVLGSASSVRFDEVRCVIILGSVDGEFPGTAADGGAFFSDRDKLLLEEHGLTLGTPDSAAETAREYFMYYRAVAAAKERLYVLAPTGEDGDWSEGGRRIRAILTELGRRAEVRFGSMPLDEIVYHPATAEYLLARRTDPAEQAALYALIGRDRKTEVPLTAEHDRIAARIPTDGKPFTLSQSRINAFVSCPFNYTCHYLVKVQPQTVAELGMNDIGTLIHYVLERFFAELTPEERADLSVMTDETLTATADGIIDDYVRSLAAATGGRKSAISEGRLDYLIRRLRRYVLVFLRALVDELAAGRFRPAAYELPIGTGQPGSVEPLRFRTADGTEVILRGVADRVDVYETDGKQYVRIIDYKTGSKNFSLEQVKRGLDVQLLIYLFSIWKYGLPDGGSAERIPAGAAYFSARPNMVTVGHPMDADEARDEVIGRIVRSGVYLKEQDVLDAMDAGLSGRYVDVKEKSGGLTGSAKAVLLDAEAFGSLCADLEDVIGRIAGEMCGGQAGAQPQQTGNQLPCAYCDHRLICRRRETGEGQTNE